MQSLPWIASLCQGWRLSQIKTFTALWQAFAHICSPLLSKVAFQLTLQTQTGINHTLKRLARFLSNPRINEAQFYENVAAFVWPRVLHWQWVPIAIDWTYCEEHDPWQSLVASIVIRGRGIPILVWSFPRDQFGRYSSQNRVEEAFIQELRRILPKHPASVILADRGFCRASFFQCLRTAGFEFVARLRCNVAVTVDGKKMLVGDIPVGRGQLRHWKQVPYKSDAACVLTQLVITRPSQEKPGEMDPWFLASSLHLCPPRIVTLYAKRMIIEEDFRTAKSDLGWKHCRIRKLRHYRRFMLLMVATLVFAMLIGMAAERKPALAKAVARKRKGEFDSCVTRIGLQLLRSGFHVLNYLALVARLPNPLL